MTTTTQAAAASTVDLESKLISDVPAGFTRVSDAEADTGPSDKAKALADEESETAKPILESSFVQGYQRLWSKGEESGLLVFVYRFNSPESAQAYHADGLQQIAASGAGEGTALEGIPGGKVFVGEDEGVQSSIAVFTRDAYAVMINLGGTEGSVTDLAAQQYAKLA